MIPESLLIETPTHGRALVRRATVPRVAGLLVGFHGYAETAEIQMERLAEIPGADAWALLSVQALHRFYRGRSEEVVASWMTRQDRDAAIADNVRYIDAAIRAVRSAGPVVKPERVVYAGFSQGVPMAFRSALRGRNSCAGVIAIGGEIPPELAADKSLRFPPVLLVRGARDEWYTQARFDADVESLQSRTAHVSPIVFDGAHEWGLDASSAAGSFLSALQSE
jgi:predicted esterase